MKADRGSPDFCIYLKQFIKDLETHNFGNFSTFAKLLDRVRVLHIVHGDGVDHDHSVIFPADEKKKEIRATLESPWLERNSIPVKKENKQADSDGGRLTAAGLRRGLLSARPR